MRKSAEGRIRERYDRYAAQYETVRGQLDELVSRADQIQCGIRALASLLDEVRHVHNLIRAVGHEGSLGEYLDLVMDLLHLDLPAHGMVYEPIPTAPCPKIRVLPPQPVASSSKKRTRDDGDIPDLSPNKTFDGESFDAYLKSHTGIASTLEKKVGSERIVFAGVRFPYSFPSFPPLFLYLTVRLLGLRAVRADGPVLHHPLRVVV
jgi:hypothetical protein